MVLVSLRNYILGNAPWNEPVTSDQWLALADANGDGILNNSDASNTNLPVGSAVLGMMVLLQDQNSQQRLNLHVP